LTAVVPSVQDLQLLYIYLDVNESIVMTSNVWSGLDSEGTLTACVSMTTLNDPSFSIPAKLSGFRHFISFEMSWFTNFVSS
jgi:hypothetical protein